MTVQQLVVILVFSQKGVRARPSTPPSWFLPWPLCSYLVEIIRLSYCSVCTMHYSLADLLYTYYVPSTVLGTIYLVVREYESPDLMSS